MELSREERIHLAPRTTSEIEWVDAEKLREVVADHHIDMSEELMEALGALLPTPPSPKSASPRPEDVPEGETWLVRPYENADPVPAFRVHASKYGPGRRWAYFRVGGSMIGFADDEEVTLVARLAPETTEQDDEPDFDPAYTYSDRHGDVWHYEEEEWWCYQNHYRTFRANGTPPAEYGPYTRIEDTDNE